MLIELHGLGTDTISASLENRSAKSLARKLKELAEADLAEYEIGPSFLAELKVELATAKISICPNACQTVDAILAGPSKGAFGTEHVRFLRIYGRVDMIHATKMLLHESWTERLIQLVVADFHSHPGLSQSQGG